MTTFNGARLIRASLASVLGQTFTDFELVVVDDGSTDTTVAVIEGLGDPRVRLIRMAANGGIVAARNVGFNVARGGYIAALDHDDLADPERLERQVAYLDDHPAVVLLATEVRIDDNGSMRRPDHPGEGDGLAMRWQLLVDNPLTWSSVMFRADAVRRLGAFMRAAYEPADDFDFYHRMLGLGDIVRLGEVLTTYRYHGGNASHTAADRLNRNAAKVLASAYEPWLGASAAESADLVVRHLSDRQPARDRATLMRLGQVMESLLGRFLDDRGLSEVDRTAVSRLAGGAWWRCVRAAARSGSPGLMWEYGRARSLAARYRPGWGDVVVSVGVGMVRRTFSR